MLVCYAQRWIRFGERLQYHVSAVFNLLLHPQAFYSTEITSHECWLKSVALLFVEHCIYRTKKKTDEKIMRCFSGSMHFDHQQVEANKYRRLNPLKMGLFLIRSHYKLCWIRSNLLLNAAMWTSVSRDSNYWKWSNNGEALARARQPFNGFHNC